VIRFLVDEDFNNDVVRGLLRRVSEADLVRVQDLGLRGATDDTVLARAASEGRVVLTHDVSTLIAHAYERVRAGQPMPGVIAVSQSLPVAQVIEDLLLVAQCSATDDWTHQVVYLPLR
jgi:predicted nuclease of predicted toxin-antitoxin system